MKEEKKTITTSLKKENVKKLKELAFLEEKQMNEILDEEIEGRYEKVKKGE